MFNLFALSDDPANRRLRFSLSAEVQQELTTLLQQQKDAFCSAEEVTFDGKYKPDVGEVLLISDFDDIDGLGDAITNPLSIPEVSPSAETFGAIKALFSGYIDAENRPVALVQHFDKRRVISTDGLSIFHSANVYKKIEGVGLTLDCKLAAVLESGSLKFHSFHLLRQIFDVSAYYKEATDGDIQQFASMPCLRVSATPTLVANSDTWVRRKLWLVLQSQILEKVPVADMKAVAAEFNIHLDTVVDDGSEKIVIPEEKKALKTILRFLDEDYYKSPLLQNRYVTNSKRPVE